MTFDFMGSDIFLSMLPVASIGVFAVSMVCLFIIFYKKRKNKIKTRLLLAMEAREAAYRASEKERMRYIQTERLKKIYLVEAKASKEAEVRAKQESEMRTLIERYGGPDLIKNSFNDRHKTIEDELELEEVYSEDESIGEETPIQEPCPSAEDNRSNEDISRDWLDIEKVYTTLLNTKN